MLLVVGRLRRACRVLNLGRAHWWQFFLDKHTFLDHNCVAEALVDVCHLIVTRCIDLEAHLARLIEAPVPDLHIISTCNRVLTACLRLAGQTFDRARRIWNEDGPADIWTLAGVVEKLEALVGRYVHQL